MFDDRKDNASLTTSGEPKGHGETQKANSEAVIEHACQWRVRETTINGLPTEDCVRDVKAAYRW